MASGKPAILIVGSGPAGLVLALTLLKNGIPVRIIEQNASFHEGARGTAIQPRTQELLNFLGIIDETMKWTEEAESCPQIPFSQVASTSQAQLEKILRRHIENLGAHVELGVTLTGVEQTADTVTARLTSKGVEELFECQYIVGADGAKGIVKKLLGLPFVGQTKTADRILTANVDVKDFNREYWDMWGSFSTASIGLKPLEPPPLFQLQAVGPNLPAILPVDPVGVQDLFNSITGSTDIKLENVCCVTDWRANIRMVQSFSVGRVFLAGDSAHCHSPAGGQGGNTAMQDSFNLAWKLSLVIRRLAPATLLETYALERMPVVAEMLNLSTELHSLAFPQLDSSSLEAGKAPRVEDVMFRPRSFLQLGINYRWSSIVIDERGGEGEGKGPETPQEISPYGSGVDKLRAGDRAPDATVLLDGSDSMTLHGVFSVRNHTVLVFPGTADGTELQSDLATVGVFRKPGVASLVLISQTKHAQFRDISTVCDRVLVDTAGHATSGYGILDDTKAFVVIRPDGIIGAYVLAAEGVIRYFSNILNLLYTVHERDTGEDAYRSDTAVWFERSPSPYRRCPICSARDDTHDTGEDVHRSDTAV
ncbi:Pentachlorophenol 4-monooxygenase [Grifola frondosa]|uniref:Pentachlorophenol 4-monooxygenase n=1 Tax=Grifola frondosa TaxID=5627 RepID=A0A1C7MHG2_GRIFR|nr:Pentachlorophenol 4-monooxygenase [Grifola frondosa]